MQLHQIKPKTPQKDGRYVGRGGKRGKTAGRGTKGQKARAGAKFRPEIRDIIKRLPKMRGRGKNSNKSVYVKAETVNLGDIEMMFKANEVVNPETLLGYGLVRRMAGNLPKVKILGGGELTKKLSFENCGFAASAKAKIEKSGSTIK
jgi:large subunit ribosomal protein L15